MQRSIRNGFIVNGFIVLVIALAIAGPGLVRAQGQPAIVEVDPVRMDQVSDHVQLLGTVIARREVSIAASVAGPVARMMVNIGDRVEAGDVIARLSDDLLQAELAQAQAQLDYALAAAETQRHRIQLGAQELDRLRKLRGSVSFSPARLEDKEQEMVATRSQLEELKANIVAAQATRENRQINLMRAQIRAPFSGIVTEKHIEAGAYAAIGTPIVSMLDDLDVEIATDVPTDLIDGLDIGRQVRVVFGSGEEARARLRALSASETLATRTRRVWFSRTDGSKWPKTLAVNQSVDVFVPRGAGGVRLTIHKDAVILRGGERMAFIVEDGLAKLRTLELGDSIQDRFVVKSGVVDGEEAVIRGNERLRPDQPVALVNR
ncbi:MAG: efflux RND transporter periplasmic adaptor subunit [Pseudomonadota bacterium]